MQEYQQGRTIAVLAKRPYWRERDARLVVEAWRWSGESQASFARRHGLDPKRLGRWARRLGASAGRLRVKAVRQEAIRFHPVRLIGQESAVRGAPYAAAPGGIEIVLPGGQCIRVAGGFDLGDLARVLLAVAQADAVAPGGEA
jgi:hypothetical protein